MTDKDKAAREAEAFIEWLARTYGDVEAIRFRQSNIERKRISDSARGAGRWQVLTFPGLYGEPRYFKSKWRAMLFIRWQMVKSFFTFDVRERRLVDRETGKHVYVW